MNIHSAFDNILLRENFYNIFVPSLSSQKNQVISVYLKFLFIFCQLFQIDANKKRQCDNLYN